VHIIIDLAGALGTAPAALLAEPEQDAQAERINRLAAIFSGLTEDEAQFMESQLAVWIGQLRKRPQ